VRSQRRSCVILPLAAAVSGLALLARCGSGSARHPAPSLPGRPTSSATPLAGQPAEAILAEAIGAVRAAGSVRLVAHIASRSKAITFIDDISATGGRERIATIGGGMRLSC
jgi:hypothetical protein